MKLINSSKLEEYKRQLEANRSQQAEESWDELEDF